MKSARLIINSKGASLIEVVLAAATFSLIVSAIVGALIYGRESTWLSGKKDQAVRVAEEGLEAVRNIRDGGGFAVLNDGAYGLSLDSGKWSLTSTEDNVGGYTRQIIISTLNPNTKKITVNISWSGIDLRTGNFSLTQNLTSWQEGVQKKRKGLVVFADGGSTSDLISYKVMDTMAGIWTASQPVADVDIATTNKVAYATKVYASETRNEKVLISRHFNGASQQIYAQVFNGATWGNVKMLATWNASTFLDVQNFDATYLNNGDLMIVFSDNTTTPKSITWNGLTWSATVALRNIGGVPNYIVAKSRDNTNEVMTAFFDQGSDTNTMYYNGNGNITTNWTLHTEHAAVAPINTKKFVDFDWSRNNLTKGALVFSNSSTDQSMDAKIWTANGAGSGTWSSIVSTPNLTPKSNRVGSMSVVGGVSNNEFTACVKGATVNPGIFCYQLTTNPSFTVPVNNTLSATSDSGLLPSWGLGYEQSGGTLLGVFSDGSSSAKFKKFDVGSSTWDSGDGSVGSVGKNKAKAASVFPSLDNDDALVLMIDTAGILYSAVWDGVLNAFYTTPAINSFTTQATNGPVSGGVWYDFKWDIYNEAN